LTPLTGIGAAVALAFAEAGCKRIAITDVNGELLDKTKSTIESTASDSEVLAVAGDISSSDFAETFVSKVVSSFGRIDYAVNMPQRHRRKLSCD